MDREPIESLLWQRLRGTGLERCELLREADAWVLRGTILVLDETATEARYRVVCDEGWRTKQVEVRIEDGSGERWQRLEVSEGRWYEGGVERDSVRGCLDVDLAWSPSTNTLPIRRLGLGIGEASGPLTAAWVRFPELRLEPLTQEYRRLAERRYRYSSAGGAFTAELEVDRHGLVLEYEGQWRRVEGS